jgi:dihydrofolate reductase
MKKVILYIATSLDGFIAKKDGSIDFLDPGNKSVDDSGINVGDNYGYNEFYASIGAIVMGNTTYKQVGDTKEFEEYYKGKPVFVFSRKPKAKKNNVTFVNEDVKEFVKKLNSNTWLVGGADIAKEFLKHNLIDEFIITIIPIVLGEGIPLFAKGCGEHKLKLLNTKSYDSGVVQLHYQL